MGKKLTSATLKATDGPDTVITGEQEKIIYNTATLGAGYAVNWGSANRGEQYEVSSKYIVYGHHNVTSSRSAEGLALDTFSGSGVVKIYDGRNGFVTDANPPDLITTIHPPESAASPFDTGNFGYSVAISPDQTKIAIGAFAYDDTLGANSGRVYLYSTGPNPEDWQLLHTYTNPNYYNTGTSDQFGYALSLTNTHIGVSAIYEDTGSYYSIGAVYVFHTTSSNQYGLTFQKQVDSNTIENNDYFGYSIAMYGDIIAVGAPYEDISSTVDEYGRMYMFNHVTGQQLTNSQLYYIYNSSYSTLAGYHVRGNSRYFYFSAPNDFYNSGRVYAFYHNGNQAFSINGVGGSFGYSFDVDYDHLYVGSYSTDRITTYDASSGSNQGTLYNPNVNTQSSSDNFGFMVRCNNSDGNSYCTQVHISARNEDFVNSDGGLSGTNSGVIYIYDDANGSAYSMARDYDWRPPANDLDFSRRYDEYFGQAMDTSSTKLVVGAPLEDDYSGTSAQSNSGGAYVYSIETGNLLASLTNPNIYGTTNSDYFGASVAISDDYIAVSAHREDVGGMNDSGVVYVYDASTYQLLHQIYNPNNYNNGSSDQFGGSGWDTSKDTMAISGDYLIVGAPWEDSTNFTTGAAYVFSLQTGQLIRTHTHSTNSNAYFGWSVCANDTYYYIASKNGDEYYSANYGGVTCYDLATGTEQWVAGQNSESSDEFGFSIACTNDNLVVGHRYSDYVGTNQGRIWVWNAETGASRFDIRNPENVGYSSSSDYFGWAVAVDDQYIFVGAPYTDAQYNIDGYTYNRANLGVVYQYDLNGNLIRTYDLRGYPEAIGLANQTAYFGSCIRMFTGGFFSSAPYRGVNYNSSGQGVVLKFT
jgi:hypothetical protein